MITEQEAREAAFRCLNGGDDTWCTSKDYYVSPKHEEDNDIVAKFVLDELARREAERAERAKPIDAEWLESLGFNKNEYGYYVKLVANVRIEASVLQSLGRSDVFVGGRHIAWEQETRGQLIDLLKALKGGEPA